METIKVAVLSDIHGNIVALEEAIKDAKLQNVDKYIVLGDIITDFPFTDEVIDIVKKLTPYVIKGNREEYLMHYEQTKNDAVWKTLQHNSVSCYYYHLREDNKEYIRNLPENLILEFEGVKIKAVHASPDSITKLLYFDTPEMDKVFKNLEEDILVYGHNHRVANYETRGKKTVAQVGPLGMHNNKLGKAQYTILDCKNRTVKLEIRTLNYDVNKLKKRIEENGGTYKEAKLWQNLCYYTVESGQDIRKEFGKIAKQEMNDKYNGNLPKGIDNHFDSFDDDIYIKVAHQFEKYIVL